MAGTHRAANKHHKRALSLVLLIATGSAVFSGCLKRREGDDQRDSEITRCASCHGDPDREGDFLLRAAPPVATSGAKDPSYPGVGAHLIHLLGTDTHAPVACAECHIVPKRPDDPGHADDGAPAEVLLGELSQAGNSSPKYDPIARRCSDTWCHGDADPLWTKPRSSMNACGTCHGLPPALPHPQAEDCSLCHGDVVAASGEFVAPELHVNGSLEFQSPPCQTCHGDMTTAAPPPDTSGDVDVEFLGVGAHRAHLRGGASGRPVSCSTCHIVPGDEDELNHIDGARALVVLTGVAESGNVVATWKPDVTTCNNTWCHSAGTGAPNVSPIWNAGEPLDCQGCHDSPPPAPHPQMAQCEACHAEVAGPDLKIISPDRHVNGIVEVKSPSDCTSCHGSDNPAPPGDLSGNRATSFSGVGAHQTHVQGTDTSRAVPCAECHLVPTQLFAAGHIDTELPAEQQFSGTATAWGSFTTFSGGSCAGSYCHGAHFPDGRNSGGNLTVPSWTAMDGSQTACGSCHGLPPPLGHPQYSDCSSCHANTRPDNRSFFDPALHVNGISETFLP